MLLASNHQFARHGAISICTLAAAKAVVFTKDRPGFDEDAVAVFDKGIDEVLHGEGPELKFIVYDFAHDESGAAKAPEAFRDLLAANSMVVMEAPVITVAWVRHCIGGADLEFALNCSMIVAEEGAKFSFAGDPFALLGVYATLGRKIGFVQTERLIENVSTPSARQMHELMVVKDVVPARSGMEGVVAYLTQAERRHNAAQAIFRAQKMAERSIAV